MGGMLRRFARCRSGVAAIEFAFVSMIFFSLIIGIIEVGRGLHMRNHLAHMLDIGAREFIMDNELTQEQLTTRMKKALTQVDPDKLSVTYANAVVGGVDCLTISVSYPFTLFFVGMGETGIDVSLERHVPYG